MSVLCESLSINSAFVRKYRNIFLILSKILYISWLWINPLHATGRFLYPPENFREPLASCVRTKWMNPLNTSENGMVVGWWWQVWWWIVYMKRLNNDSLINLFPSRTKIEGSHYFKAPTSCQQGLDLSTTRR